MGNIETRRRAIESFGDAVHLLTVAAGRCNSAIELCLYFSWVRGSISPEALVVFMVASFVIPSWRVMACEVTGNEDI